MKKQNKKWMTIFLLLGIALFLSLALTLETKAATYQSADSDFEYETVNKGIRITKYTGLSLQQISDSVYSVVIPDKINGQPVKEIAAYAFADQKHIAEFIIPKTVTKINDHAFYNCQSLTKVGLPSALTKIGDYAFYNTQLKTISIPRNVVSIGEYAFGTDGMEATVKCTSITVNKSNKKFCSVNGVLYNKSKTRLIYFPGAKKDSSFTMPSKVNTMTSWAFNDARKLTSISMNKCKIKTLPDNAFQLKKLQKITLPSTLKKIGAHTFEKSGITAISIPSKVSSIGEAAFYNCSDLKKATISCKSLTALPKNVFASCYSMTSVALPSSLETIGEAAFSNCISLKKITLPATVSNIENEAFRMCEAMTAITIKGTVTHIGFTAFDGDPNLTIVAKKGTYPESFAKQKNIKFKKL